MIPSILWTDLYKLTMQQAVWQWYPQHRATYRFFDRAGTRFRNGFDDELNAEIEKLADISLTYAEWQYLKEACPYFTEEYLDYLSTYRFKPDQVYVHQVKGKLNVEIKGPWHETILWEVPLMSIISELHFQDEQPDDAYRPRARAKGSLFLHRDIKVADFGTRRAFSTVVHDDVVQVISRAAGSLFVGTSNVALAMKYDLKPVGTYAHEWVMAHAGMFGVMGANIMAMAAWMDTYRGKLGIALTDTYTTDVFLHDFGWKEARLFDGVRQDSGDPSEFAEKMIAHYQSLGIDPRTKTIVFSDSLDAEKVVDIEHHVDSRIKTLYGIGTNFTNDVGVTPLNMVIKMTDIGSTPVAKLSDTPGKVSGAPSTVRAAQRELGL